MFSELVVKRSNHVFDHHDIYYWENLLVDGGCRVQCYWYQMLVNKLFIKKVNKINNNWFTCCTWQQSTVEHLNTTAFWHPYHVILSVYDVRIRFITYQVKRNLDLNWSDWDGEVIRVWNIEAVLKQTTIIIRT